MKSMKPERAQIYIQMYLYSQLQIQILRVPYSKI